MITLNHRRGLAVVAATGALLAAGPVMAASATTSTTPACPTTGGIPLTSTLSNGVTHIGKNATIMGSTAKACGILGFDANGNSQARIPAKNVQFAPTTTKILGLVDAPTTFRATSALTGPARITPSGVKTTLTGYVVATASVLGSSCDIPLKVTLTTGTSGTLTGVPLKVGSDSVFRGTVVSNSFAVPAIKPTATCNALAAAASNTAIGLPLPGGASTITYDVALKLGS